MIYFFLVEVPRSQRAVRAHPKPQRLPKAPKRRRSPRTKKVWRRRKRRARRRRTRKAVKTSSDRLSAMLRWWPKIGVIEKSNGRLPSWRHWWSLIKPWLKWAGRGRYLGRDIMIRIIEVLIKEAYLIRVYIIKSTIIAIINVSWDDLRQLLLAVKAVFSCIHSPVNINIYYQSFSSLMGSGLNYSCIICVFESLTLTLIL